MKFQKLSKSGGRITKDIVISDCVVSSHCNAIKMGTESHGGFKNITINNCVIKPSLTDFIFSGKKEGSGGVLLEIVDGGSMDGINVSNIVVNGTSTPLFIKLGNRARKYDPAMQTPEIGEIKNISISNFTANGGGKFSSSISGLPNHPVKNILLNNIRINSIGGFSSIQPMPKIEEVENAYPEGSMFGELPAYGFFLRHVENLNINNVQLLFEKPDTRPAIYAEDMKGFTITNLSAMTTDDSPELLYMKNIKNAVIQALRSSADKKPIIKLLDSNLSGITFDNNKNYIIKNK